MNRDGVDAYVNKFMRDQKGDVHSKQEANLRGVFFATLLASYHGDIWALCAFSCPED